MAKPRVISYHPRQGTKIGLYFIQPIRKTRAKNQLCSFKTYETYDYAQFSD